MLSRLLIAGVLAGTGAGGLLGQTSGSVPFDWGSVVGGALGSSPVAVVLAWRLNKADKETAGLHDELRAMHAQTLNMVERMAPVLGDATRTLEAVRSGMKATLDRDHPTNPDQTLRRLEDLIKDMTRDHRGHDDH